MNPLAATLWRLAALWSDPNRDPVDEMSLARRAEVRDALVRLVAKQGTTRLELDDLLRAAGVSAGAFFEAATSIRDPRYPNLTTESLLNYVRDTEAESSDQDGCGGHGGDGANGKRAGLERSS